MKERPILFSAPMVRAILDGTKTQTRRVIKATACGGKKQVILTDNKEWWINCATRGTGRSPYGQPGDRLWVRERLNLRAVINKETFETGIAAFYAAGGGKAFMWNGRTDVESIPSIHMPRWASRIQLEITDVRVERLQDISEADAMAEGCSFRPGLTSSRRQEFSNLWEAINGAGSWQANPWVWVIEFERITK